MAMGEMLQHPLFQSASESQLKATLPVGQAGTLGSQPL
jgi:hypothetical protein